MPFPCFLFVALCAALVAGQPSNAELPAGALQDQEFLDFLKLFLQQRRAGEPTAAPDDLETALNSFRGMDTGRNPSDLHMALGASHIVNDLDFVQRMRLTYQHLPFEEQKQMAAFLAQERIFDIQKVNSRMIERASALEHAGKLKAGDNVIVRKLKELKLKRAKALRSAWTKYREMGDTLNTPVFVENAAGGKSLRAGEKKIQKIALSFNDALKHMDEMEVAARRGVAGAEAKYQLAKHEFERIGRMGTSLGPEDLPKSGKQSAKAIKRDKFMSRASKALDNTYGRVLNAGDGIKNSVRFKKFQAVAERIQKPFARASAIARHIPEKIFGKAPKIDHFRAPTTSKLAEQFGKVANRVKEVGYMVAPGITMRLDKSAIRATSSWNMASKLPGWAMPAYRHSGVGHVARKVAVAARLGGLAPVARQAAVLGKAGKNALVKSAKMIAKPLLSVLTPVFAFHTAAEAVKDWHELQDMAAHNGTLDRQKIRNLMFLIGDLWIGRGQTEVIGGALVNGTRGVLKHLVMCSNVMHNKKRCFDNTIKAIKAVREGAGKAINWIADATRKGVKHMKDAHNKCTEEHGHIKCIGKGAVAIGKGIGKGISKIGGWFADHYNFYKDRQVEKKVKAAACIEEKGEEECEREAEIRKENVSKTWRAWRKGHHETLKAAPAKAWNAVKSWFKKSDDEEE